MQLVLLFTTSVMCFYVIRISAKLKFINLFVQMENVARIPISEDETDFNTLEDRVSIVHACKLLLDTFSFYF